MLNKRHQILSSSDLREMRRVWTTSNKNVCRVGRERGRERERGRAVVQVEDREKPLAVKKILFSIILTVLCGL